MEDSSGTVCDMGSQNQIPSGSGDEAFVVAKVIDKDTDGEIIVTPFNKNDYSVAKEKHGYICEKEGS